LGILLRGLGRQAEAEAEYRQALALWEKLAADAPAVPDYRVYLGGSCCNLGNLVRNGDRPADSLAWYARAVATLAPLVEAGPRLARGRLVPAQRSRGRSRGSRPPGPARGGAAGLGPGRGTHPARGTAPCPGRAGRHARPGGPGRGGCR